MMQMGPSSNDTPQATSFNNADSSNGLALSRHDRNQRRKRMKCQSEGVALMRSSFDKTNTRVRHCSHVGEISNHQQPQLETLSELVNLPAKVSDLRLMPNLLLRSLTFLVSSGSASNSRRTQEERKKGAASSHIRWCIFDEIAS